MYRLSKIIAGLILLYGCASPKVDDTAIVASAEIEMIPIKEYEPQTDPVVFTNYYTGDSTGSGTRTGSGMLISKFKPNEKGWLTYDGFVVVATATKECMKSTSGACSKYKELPEGFHIFEYWDVLRLEIEGVFYDAVVLDSCGACFWEGDLQRVDILISGKQFSFGKMKGSVIYE